MFPDHAWGKFIDKWVPCGLHEYMRFNVPYCHTFTLYTQIYFIQCIFYTVKIIFYKCFKQIPRKISFIFMLIKQYFNSYFIDVDQIIYYINIINHKKIFLKFN